MLLVHHDQAQARQGSEGRQPGAQHQVRLARECGEEALGTHAFGQPAVQAHQPGAGKAAGDPLLQLGRERNLGHQHEHLSSALQASLRQA